MNNHVFFYAISLALVGCASPSAKVIKAPDGTTMQAITCNMDSSKCLEVATEACAATGGSYQVISSHSNAGGTGADVIPGPVTWYRMSVVCGPSDGKLPTFPFRGPQPVVPDFSQKERKSIQTNCTNIGNNINCTSR